MLTLPHLNGKMLADSDHPCLTPIENEAVGLFLAAEAGQAVAEVRAAYTAPIPLSAG